MEGDARASGQKGSLATEGREVRLGLWGQVVEGENELGVADKLSCLRLPKFVLMCMGMWLQALTNS